MKRTSLPNPKSRNGKSIQITLAARLEKFNLESLAGLTATDELDLPSLGEKKVALFAILPDNDTSFNFHVSILYTQRFHQLFYLADHKYGGSLPVHCHFIMDEFANVSLPDDFDKILSVMRSRGVSVSIILQNLAQLKALFEKQWESIVGNCDEFLYLGGNEQSTHKYVSELLGKATIDTNTYGKSTGRSGNYSTKRALPLVFFSSFKMEYKRMAMFFALAPVILAATSNPSKLILTICSAASPPVFIIHQLLSLLFFFICPYDFQFFFEGIAAGFDTLAQSDLLSDNL